MKSHRSGACPFLPRREQDALAKLKALRRGHFRVQGEVVNPWKSKNKYHIWLFNVFPWTISILSSVKHHEPSVKWTIVQSHFKSPEGTLQGIRILKMNRN